MGRKLANDAFILWCKSMIMAPFHSVVGIFIFVDNFVVVLNVCGNSPRMSFEPLDTIKDTSMSDHVLSLKNMDKTLIISHISEHFPQNNPGYLDEIVVFFMCPVIASFFSPR